MKMNTKKLVLNAVLLGIGLVLHQIEPAIFGIKPDMTLIMLFTIFIINKGDYKSCLIAGVVAGIFSGMTTTFPGGQIPNVLDKLITTNITYVIMMLIYKVPFISKLQEKTQDLILSCLILSLGTVISGFTFLTSAQILVGLPGDFSMLFMAVVVPAVIINLFVGLLVFKFIHVTMRRVSFQS
ncbi:tryptophan transporter [Terrisporobacter sp.]|uniref:tryptophan transporter n=1 Tax=Terrisporobacter sp. TaxID=1965305 RepID=UPI00262824D2|nr:tryptophan transporter [Terrisporobacter sp.]